MPEEEHYLDQIKKSVTFIFILRHNVVKPLGTGFFVGIWMDKIGAYVTYLVTAKHVLQSEDGNIFTEIYLRLNGKDDAPLQLFSFESNSILTHPDKDVDIVCIPCSLNNKEFDVLYLPSSYFADKKVIKEKKISVGTDIFYCGLFSKYMGFKKNHPIFKFGRVSSLTDEKIRITKPEEPYKTAHLYLFETHSLSGFSGAPVFFELDRLSQMNAIRYGNPEIYLAGVMKGHYSDFIINRIQDIKEKDILLEQNFGIAVVTPCYLLSEILYSPSEIEFREKVDPLDLNKRGFMKNIRL